MGTLNEILREVHRLEAKNAELARSQLSNAQHHAIVCALLDLMGAVEVDAASDPLVRLDRDSVLETIADLRAAFPAASADAPAPEGFPPECWPA